MGKAGDPLPRFKRHMIRQRVDRHGNISELEHESELHGCTLPIDEIGVIKEGTVKKWIVAKTRWDIKFAAAKRKVQRQRILEYSKGYQQFSPGERPPPSALAGRRLRKKDLKEEKRQKNVALSLWALWGSKHDEETIEHEKQMEIGPDVLVAAPTNEDGPSDAPGTSQTRAWSKGHSRSRSRRRIVTDEHQTEDSDIEIDEDTPAHVLHRRLTRERGPIPGGSGTLTPDFLSTPRFNSMEAQSHLSTLLVDETELKRPKLGGIAFPFSLKQDGASASMVTLTSSVGVGPVADVETEGAKESGVAANEVDIEAARAARGSSAVAGASDPAGSVERPPVETFFSAQEDLPKASN